MKIGIQLPEVEREVSWPEIREIAITAEETGFDSIWVGDHLLFRDELTGTRGPWEAWTMLAALAEATSRAELGPLVAATSFHSPAMLAKMAATVDEISGGRLVLGLGAGWNRAEYEAFGFPFDNRVSRFEEAFTVVRTLLRSGEIDFQGTYYTHRDCELLPRPGRAIPLMVGSNGPRMLRITAPHVDQWNSWFVWFENDPAGLTPLIRELEKACHETGRDPEEVAKTAAVYVQLARGEGRVGGSKDRPKSSPISGDSEEIARRLHEFSTVGVEHLQLVVDPIDARAVEELGEVLALIPSWGPE
jgi:probable F420-dependent oxidoreductase